MREGGLDGVSFELQTPSSDTTTCNTPIFLSLSDKESVIVSAVIIVHTWRKRERLKQGHFLHDFIEISNSRL